MKPTGTKRLLAALATTGTVLVSGLVLASPAHADDHNLTPNCVDAGERNAVRHSNFTMNKVQNIFGVTGHRLWIGWIGNKTEEVVRSYARCPGGPLEGVRVYVSYQRHQRSDGYITAWRFVRFEAME